MDYEKYLQNMKNSSIRTNLLNQRLAELGENYPPLTSENFPKEGGRRLPYKTLYDNIDEYEFPKTVAETNNTKLRQALGVVPKEWSQNTKFNLMNPALSDAEREAIRREFEARADHEIYMNSRHDGTVDPANFNRITRGLMSAIYGPQASNMIDFQNNVGDAYSERGEKIGLEMNNPAAASLGLPNTWNAPQLFNPNFNPNQSVVKARPQTYKPKDFGGIASEIKGFRWIPSHHMETAGKAIPVIPSRDRRPGTTYGWEEDLQRMKLGLEPISQGRKQFVSKPKPLPGLFTDETTMDYKFGEFNQPKIPTPVATPRKIAGQFMSPPILDSLAMPDVVPSSRGINTPFSLLGVLERPHFTRNVEEGSGGVAEGFHFGELGADDVIHIPTAGKGPEGMMEFLDKYRTHEELERATGLSRGEKDLANILYHVPSMQDMNMTDASQAFLQQGAQDMNLDQLINAGLVQAGEPMDIAMQLLKREMSPEARQHKLEYDKKYESSPERVKYREELNRERRKRGIYGSGDHMDVSHTEGGKLTLEGEHENRARHFKERGTLRPSKIAVRKDN